MHFLKYLHCFNPNLSTIAQENLKSVSDEELLKNSCLLVYIYRKRVWTYVIIHNLLGGKLIDLNVWIKKNGFHNQINNHFTFMAILPSQISSSSKLKSTDSPVTCSEEIGIHSSWFWENDKLILPCLYLASGASY